MIFFPNLNFHARRADLSKPYIFRTVMSIDSSATGNKEKSFSTFRMVDYKITAHASKGLFTWREEDPSARKILEGGSS